MINCFCMNSTKKFTIIEIQTQNNNNNRARKSELPHCYTLCHCLQCSIYIVWLNTVSNIRAHTSSAWKDGWTLIKLHTKVSKIIMICIYMFLYCYELCYCFNTRCQHMLKALISPYENRSWAQTNWILVRIWKVGTRK
jgi:hypothetical protein